MPLMDNEIDANFFRLIHQLSLASNRERRGSRRKPFQVMQRIALPRGPGIPPESEFIDVQCRDLTRQGFSFLLPKRPKFERLVAAFGIPPEVIYVAAQVVRCQDVLVQPADGGQGDGGDAPGDGEGPSPKPMILVGCRFTERLHKA